MRWAVVVLTVAAAAAVLLALRSVLDARAARLSVLLWVVVPSHLAAERWASASQAMLAVALLAIGATCLLAVARRPSPLPWLAGGALLGLAVAAYEVVVVVAVLVPVAVVVGSRFRGSQLLGRLLLAEAPVAAALAVNLGYDSVYPELTGSGSVTGFLFAHLGLGFYGPVYSAVTIMTLIGVAALLRARLLGFRRGGWGAVLSPERRQPLLLGMALLLTGAAPAFSIPNTFVGMYGRLVVVSGVGSALVLVAIVDAIGRRWSRWHLTELALVGLLVAAGGARLSLEGDWRDAAELGLAVADRAAATLPSDRPVTVVDLPVARGVASIADGWHVADAVRVLTGRSVGPVCVHQGQQRAGPGCATDPADDPPVVDLGPLPG